MYVIIGSCDSLLGVKFVFHVTGYVVSVGGNTLSFHHKFGLNLNQLHI